MNMEFSELNKIVYTMKYFVTTLTITIITTFSFAQKATQLEIDRLYKQYKDKESITITFPNGTISANVNTYLNEQDKPYEIELSGKESDGKTLSYFLSYFIKQKASKGFKEQGYFSYKDTYTPDWIQHAFESPFDPGIELSLEKGKEYCIITATKTKVKKWNTGIDHLDYEYSFTFTLTNGDMRRKGGDKSKPFDF